MLTIDDVRFYLADRTPADNPLLRDLAYSDKEIQFAMKSAARAFNSIPPIRLMAVWNQLPDDTNIFLNGITACLFRTAVARLSRNDIQYSAGNVTTQVRGLHIQHFSRLVEEYQKTFMEAAEAVKVQHNVSLGYGAL